MAAVRGKRRIRERTIVLVSSRVSEQAKNASAVVDEAHNPGLDGSHPVTLQAKMLRLELLNVKAGLERELGRLILHCTACGQRVHWVQDSVSRRDIGRIANPRRMASPVCKRERRRAKDSGEPPVASCLFLGCGSHRPLTLWRDDAGDVRHMPAPHGEPVVS